jgi:hypothetical protein
MQCCPLPSFAHCPLPSFADSVICPLLHCYPLPWLLPIAIVALAVVAWFLAVVALVMVPRCCRRCHGSLPFLPLPLFLAVVALAMFVVAHSVVAVAMVPCHYCGSLLWLPLPCFLAFAMAVIAVAATCGSVVVAKEPFHGYIGDLLGVPQGKQKLWRTGALFVPVRVVVGTIFF